jgi:hypothetical protein
MTENEYKIDWSQQRADTHQAKSWDKHSVPERDASDFPKAAWGQEEQRDSPVADLAWVQAAAKKRHAYTFLQKAVDAMKDRAAQRDVAATDPQKAGERSMKATVAAFNGLTGKNLTEEEGWEFMILLKMVRGRQGDFRDDDYIDGAAYFGLLGECASIARSK